MKPVIDLNECLRDSPKFRCDVNQNEDNIEILEVKLEKLVKLCNAMVDTGKSYVKSKSVFINAIWEVSVYFNEDVPVVGPLNKIIQTLTELNKYHQMLIDQISRAVSRNLDQFVRSEISKVKETKRHFDKISDDYDNILVRNSQTLKSKQSDCEETYNLLTATRSCFKHTALDYVSQICCLQSRKRHEVLHSLLSLLQAYGTYFHQGIDLFEDIDPFIKETASLIQQLRNASNGLQKQLDGNHSFAANDNTVTVLSKGEQIWLEGYLFKRTSNAFKTWNRRWFIVKDSQLVYQKRNESSLTVMEDDLRLCKVRPVMDTERRFCFEIVSPSKSHVLQADSEEACHVWINTLRAGIDAAYNDSSNVGQMEAVSIDSLDSVGTGSSNATSKSTHESSDSSQVLTKPLPAAHSQILSVIGNEICCDCKSLETKWASINLGITLCIECSGIHRSLGVHISKVRSLFLDDWDSDIVKLMLSLGNNLINSIYEENVDESIARRPCHTSDRSLREAWIKAKYVKKAFVNRAITSTVCDYVARNGESNDEENNKMKPDTKEVYCEMLYKAACNADSMKMSEALAKGANINWSNEVDQGKRPLHQVILSGSLVAAEYLLLNGAKTNLSDSMKRTPLHLATEMSNTGLVCLLLKRGADQSIVDDDGQDALAIAVKNANADIVTLLRIAKLNEEMKKDEYGNSHEEIFNEVVRDFSNLASTSPSKPVRDPKEV